MDKLLDGHRWFVIAVTVTALMQREWSLLEVSGLPFGSGFRNMLYFFLLTKSPATAFPASLAAS